MRKAIFNSILFLTILGATDAAFAAESAKMPKPGDKAPLIDGTDQAGKPWALKNSIGKQVVLLYFYPKDDTPGCTKEACGLRDQMSDLKKDNVQVIGVSFDSGDSHQKFISKYGLNFPLLADTDGKVADAFGVRIAGRSMARRVSFLIDKEGKIRHVTDSPKAEIHLAEMKEAVAALK